jgi:hypothetical protein
LLSFPAYRGFVHPAKTVAVKLGPTPNQALKPEFGVSPVPSFSLDRVRSASQSAKTSVIRLSGEEDFFLLTFFVPVKPSPPYRYDIVMVRKDMTAVVPSQALRNCDETGNCSLLCNAALFPPDSYVLRIEETAPTGSKMVRPFPFQVTR